MKLISQGTIILFLIPIITILLIAFIGYYGYGRPFLSSLVWSMLMIGVIFLRVYLSEKDSKILLFLGSIIGIAGVFFVLVRY
ncbi:hypothetical protein [Caloranaerobacter sp. DY30410]|uniref:hypothetical protein n=1 Tax=Caloranaerobacter sp. DY30410 TaxID=3238305 RepID=UPI003D08A0B6